MSPEVYVLLALLLSLTVGLVLLFQRLERFRLQAESVAKRQDEADAALREQVKASAEKLDQRLLRLMEADAKAQAALDALIRAQHAATEANSRATEQLAGAVSDLRLALLESTKL
jgi:hypothetical protein